MKKRLVKKTERKRTEAAARRMETTLVADLTATADRLMETENRLRAAQRQERDTRTQLHFTQKQAQLFWENWQQSRTLARKNLAFGLTAGAVLGFLAGLALVNWAGK